MRHTTLARNVYGIYVNKMQGDGYKNRQLNYLNGISQKEDEKKIKNIHNIY